MSDQSNLRVVVLEGPPRRRGQIHGQVLKPMILEHVKRWRTYLKEATGADPDEYKQKLIQKTGFLSAAQRWAPDLMEEVAGIAEGAGLSFETVFGLQLIDEEWWYRQEQGLGQGFMEREQCSALGAFRQGENPPLMAQNLDLPLPNYYEGLKVLLHLKDPQLALESLIFTAAGVIAYGGLNNQPLGVCVNTLIQLNHSADGLPVAFVIRGILAQKTFDEAVGYIHRVKHASGQNYTIGGPEDVAAYECSANKVCLVDQDQGWSGVCHTNHPLVNNDLGQTPAKWLSKNSEARLSSLEKRLKEARVPLTIETVKSILSSHDSSEHPVCVHPKLEGKAMTVACWIMILSSHPCLHLALGPPCSTAFNEVSL